MNTGSDLPMSSAFGYKPPGDDPGHVAAVVFLLIATVVAFLVLMGCVR